MDKDKIEPIKQGDKTVYEGQGSESETTPVTNVYISNNSKPAPPTVQVGRISFVAEHHRSVVGNDLYVRVESFQPLTSVRVTLDGQTIANESMSGKPTAWEKSFSQAGAASPGRKHKLVLEGCDEANLSQSYIHEWEDSI